MIPRYSQQTSTTIYGGNFQKKPDNIPPVIHNVPELDTELIRPNAWSLADRERGLEKGGSRIVVIGRPGTGKTTLITSLLYEKSGYIPTGLVVSGTEDSNKYFSNLFPSSFVYNSLDLKIVEKFKTRQSIARQYVENPWGVLLLDDCMADTKQFNKPIMIDTMKNGRHWAMLFILSLQYCMDVKPDIRQCIDGVFIMREPILKIRYKIWENYAGIIPDFDIFCQLMDQVCKNYTALYIVCNDPNIDRWEDAVYWYRAKPLPEGWKFGSPQIWAYHNERYNNQYNALTFRE